jgi:N-acyl-D-aspartate/D-glutamate deacylase
MDWMRRLAAAINRPVTFALSQNNADPDSWRRLLDLSAAAAAEGIPVRPQVHGRTTSLLLGFQTFHPLAFTRAWGEAGLGLLSWQEQVVRIQADPALAARIVVDAADLKDDPIVTGFMHPDRIYLLGDPPIYEPGIERSATAMAAARGVDPWALLLELFLGDGGRELLNAPVLNYTHGNLDAVGEMLQHPTSAFGLGDGGAHAGQTCDASTTTFLLTHWARDRDHGRLTVENAVHKMTQATATLYGLGDRGVLAPGYVGDANVIDHQRLQLRRPELANDLPGGASRLIQRADGYVTTIKSGQPTLVGGEDTGARPGILLRGAR